MTPYAPEMADSTDSPLLLPEQVVSRARAAMANLGSGDQQSIPQMSTLTESSSDSVQDSTPSSAKSESRYAYLFFEKRVRNQQPHRPRPQLSSNYAPFTAFPSPVVSSDNTPQLARDFVPLQYASPAVSSPSQGPTARVRTKPLNHLSSPIAQEEQRTVKLRSATKIPLEISTPLSSQTDAQIIRNQSVSTAFGRLSSPHSSPSSQGQLGGPLFSRISSPQSSSSPGRTSTALKVATESIQPPSPSRRQNSEFSPTALGRLSSPQQSVASSGRAASNQPSPLRQSVSSSRIPANASSGDGGSDHHRPSSSFRGPSVSLGINASGFDDTTRFSPQQSRSRNLTASRSKISDGSTSQHGSNGKTPSPSFRKSSSVQPQRSTGSSSRNTADCAVHSAGQSVGGNRSTISRKSSSVQPSPSRGQSAKIARSSVSRTSPPRLRSSTRNSSQLHTPRLTTPQSTPQSTPLPVSGRVDRRSGAVVERSPLKSARKPVKESSFDNRTSVRDVQPTDKFPPQDESEWTEDFPPELNNGEGRDGGEGEEPVAEIELEMDDDDVHGESNEVAKIASPTKRSRGRSAMSPYVPTPNRSFKKRTPGGGTKSDVNSSGTRVKPLISTSIADDDNDDSSDENEEQEEEAEQSEYSENRVAVQEDIVEEPSNGDLLEQSMEVEEEGRATPSFLQDPGVEEEDEADHSAEPIALPMAPSFLDRLPPQPAWYANVSLLLHLMEKDLNENGVQNGEREQFKRFRTASFKASFRVMAPSPNERIENDLMLTYAQKKDQSDLYWMCVSHDLLADPKCPFEYYSLLVKLFPFQDLVDRLLPYGPEPTDVETQRSSERAYH